MPTGYYNKTGLPVARGKHWKIKNTSKMSHKGLNTWTRGVKRSEEAKKSVSLGLKRAYQEGRRKPFWLGKKQPKEVIEKRIAPLRGKKRPDVSLRVGEKHWNWQGGKSFEEYPMDWTVTLRRSIRERDRYTCQWCGELQGDKAFDVHHINGDKKDCNLDNLITLCRTCHNRYHIKPKHNDQEE